MNIAVSISCLFVTMALFVRGYPTGAPPEACRQMIPGHGVPAQTGTSNPYRIMTTKTTFSCPGDTVTVTVTGNSFRGFLCQPVPNTGELLQNPQDPVQKQNKCGQMASLTHDDNSIKSSVSFIWKPLTTQSVNIVCTVVQTKLNFWTNVSSTTLRYIKSRCQPSRTEATEQAGSDVKQVTAVINTEDVGKDNVPDTRVNVPDSRTDQVPDTKLDNKLEEKDVHGTDTGVGIDSTDTRDSDGNNIGHTTSVLTGFMLSLVVCLLIL
ncbi:putative defense protein Hdd11 [Ruditapes philippinarum]|uniref:putative defense protein Hdd11 n=1 Tax=Ruditapes philippinarum TaxID=129788 RepID=UPI00295A71E5|nr:putative defense protein Hdd11 [Ruditapes philippinarum]